VSLSGALNSAVSGLNAQASALAMISTNLANASTTGYKSVTASFSTMLNGGSARLGAVGGVTVKGLTNVVAQGLPQPSTTTTHMAIQGNGFFVVTSGAGASDYKYTRNGEFDVNPDGFVTNAGMFLQGWPTDPDGNILGGTSAGSLTAVNINDYTTIAGATTTLGLKANLPANATGPMPMPAIAASITGTSNAAITLATAGSFTITDGTNTATVNLAAGTYSRAQLATAINTAAAAGAPAALDMTATTNGSGALVLTHNVTGPTTLTVGAFAGSMAAGITQLGLPTAVSSNGAAAYTKPADTFPSTIEIFDSLGTAATIKVTWTKTAVANEWTATYENPVSSSNPTGGPIGTLSAPMAPVTVTFNPDGSLATPSATMPLSISWSTGAAPSTITTSYGTPGQMDGLTQFSLDSDELSVALKYDQDGVNYGTLSGIFIGEGGKINARYNNGREQTIARVPIATFTNPNGLAQSSGGLYAQSSDSGPVALGIAGQDGAGSVLGASLEMSTTDTNKEFANMMAAQQAYSGSAQVMTAANDMFDTLIGAVR